MPEHLPENLLNRVNLNGIGYTEDVPLLKEVMEEMEKSTIEKALMACRGNKTLAANKLGIHRTALYKKIDKYGINQ